MPSQPDETPQEDVRHALAFLHDLRTYHLSSAESVRLERVLNDITDRLWAAVRKLEKRGGWLHESD